jgi:glycosyltransferase involved in cell wall biosynthesis
MISILIPTYNSKVDQLVTVLHKQAEQLSIAFEILVYDDGSTKRFSVNAAINQLAHVTYKYFDSNMGRSAIRQQLAQDAVAEYLLFLDADVLPVTPDFLNNYAQLISNKVEVICGGIAYKEEAAPQEMLRHTYGTKREARDAKTRQKDPFIIVTANVCMGKALFLNINTELENRYGEDLLLSQQLKKNGETVQHIDNPVWHLGLESSQEYLLKSEEALSNMVHWEKEGRLEPNFTSLQQGYLKLRKMGLVPLFRLVMRLMIPLFIKSNLTSKKPSILLFDLYRLHYYAELKKHA